MIAVEAQRRGNVLRGLVHHKLALAGAVYLALMILAIMIVPLLLPYKADQQNLAQSLLPPGSHTQGAPHVLGTDLLGRDILSRLLAGGRISLLVATAALTVQTTIGTALGLIAGYRGGKLDQVIMRVADVQFALPGLVALLAVVAVYGPGLGKLILFLGISGWPIFARLVRGQVLLLREQGFVEASRSIGATRTWILARHILPNVLPTIIVVTTISIPYVVLAEASLSFLGLGVPPSTPTWGSMVSEGQEYLNSAWWIAVFPGIAIFAFVLSVNFLGDGLRDLFDPRISHEATAKPRGKAPTQRAPAIAHVQPVATDRALSVRNLTVEFVTNRGLVHAASDVSFDVGTGEVMGLVGESGSGKTVTSLALMRLIPGQNVTVAGQVDLQGEEILRLPEHEMRMHRGRGIAMVFQDPMSSLNPLLTIGHLLIEPLRIHLKLTRRQARQRAGEWLDAVGIPDPQRRLDEYPHQLSGGMRQRVMIAMALSCEPKLLIADEPTTALDVTTQAEILELLEDLQARFRLAVILISHDFGVVASLAHYLCVMYAGRIVERGRTSDVLLNPGHPYTRELLQSRPLPGSDAELIPIEGAPPDLAALPVGCAFLPRCRYKNDARCASEQPPLREIGPEHFAATYYDLAGRAG